jgi:hypothetical protein
MLTTLPSELIARVLSRLDAASLCAVGECAQELAELSTWPPLWSKLLRSLFVFGLSPFLQYAHSSVFAVSDLGDRRWKRCYARLSCALRNLVKDVRAADQASWMQLERARKHGTQANVEAALQKHCRKRTYFDIYCAGASHL